jgi:hypothetical protein
VHQLKGVVIMKVGSGVGCVCGRVVDPPVGGGPPNPPSSFFSQLALVALPRLHRRAHPCVLPFFLSVQQKPTPNKRPPRHFCCTERKNGRTQGWARRRRGNATTYPNSQKTRVAKKGVQSFSSQLSFFFIVF